MPSGQGWKSQGTSPVSPNPHQKVFFSKRWQRKLDKVNSAKLWVHVVLCSLINGVSEEIHLTLGLESDKSVAHFVFFVHLFPNNFTGS